MIQDNPWPWLDLGERCQECSMPIVCRPIVYYGQLTVAGLEPMDFRSRDECGLNLRVRSCKARNHSLINTYRRYKAEWRRIMEKENERRETQENA